MLNRRLRLRGRQNTTDDIYKIFHNISWDSFFSPMPSVQYYLEQKHIKYKKLEKTKNPTTTANKQRKRKKETYTNARVGNVCLRSNKAFSCPQRATLFPVAKRFCRMF